MLRVNVRFIACNVSGGILLRIKANNIQFGHQARYDATKQAGYKEHQGRNAGSVNIHYVFVDHAYAKVAVEGERQHEHTTGGHYSRGEEEKELAEEYVLGEKLDLLHVDGDWKQ